LVSATRIMTITERITRWAQVTAGALALAIVLPLLFIAVLMETLDELFTRQVAVTFKKNSL
jgi:hypothetical protein